MGGNVGGTDEVGDAIEVILPPTCDEELVLFPAAIETEPKVDISTRIDDDCFGRATRELETTGPLVVTLLAFLTRSPIVGVDEESTGAVVVGFVAFDGAVEAAGEGVDVAFSNDPVKRQEKTVARAFFSITIVLLQRKTFACCAYLEIVESSTRQREEVRRMQRALFYLGWASRCSSQGAKNMRCQLF